MSRLSLECPYRPTTKTRTTSIARLKRSNLLFQYHRAATLNFAVPKLDTTEKAKDKKVIRTATAAKSAHFMFTFAADIKFYSQVSITDS